MKLKSLRRLTFSKIKYLFYGIFYLITFILIISYFFQKNEDSLDDSLNKFQNIDVVYTWVNGSDPIFQDSMRKYTKSIEKNDFSEHRFDDKHELKFSLRSLEKYAPWVRHVYIVTNGQIPNWLNLDYDKVSIVTHEQLFLNKDDLPTFSSPAIEAHIHRIPDLSVHFLYFNDDIFLYDYVYLDDFITETGGYKIYLSWPLPDCNEECSWSYLQDGSCDHQCNNEQCQYDGGDCLKSDNNADYENLFSTEYDSNTRVNASLDLETNKESVIQNKNIRTIKSYILKNITLTKSSKFVELINKSDNNITDVIKRFNKKIILRNKKNRRRKGFDNENNFNEVIDIKNNRHTISSLNYDAYASSLINVNRLYNLNFGFKSRKVVAHIPLLVNKNIIKNLQVKFVNEFIKTSSNKFRSNADMQYSFSYVYFLMSQIKNLTVSEIFDLFDTDKSRTLSDREIRTLLTRINQLPLTYEMVNDLERILIECSKNVNIFTESSTPMYERYLDSKLPTISKEMVINCRQIGKILSEHFGSTKKYKYEIMKNIQLNYVTFKMLTSNFSHVIGILDEIRKHPKKFVCLNDNMDSLKTEENAFVKTILNDFHLSLFPKPSKFELPNEYRNRFSYIYELEEWRSNRYKIKILLYVCVITLCMFFICNLRKLRICNKIKKTVC